MNTGAEVVPPEVLARYGYQCERLNWIALGNAGGFSGAKIWRGDDGAPVFALKAWPEAMVESRLREIHSRIVQARHLAFIPTVVPTLDFETVVACDGHVWDLTTWMPGLANWGNPPSLNRIVAAAVALASIHRAWRGNTTLADACPAVKHRLHRLSAWRMRAPVSPALTQGDYSRNPELFRALCRGWELANETSARFETAVRKWESRPALIQPCIRDIWGAHVLFSGDDVSGVVDYGSVKDDHVAVDLARLLGDVVGEDEIAFYTGLATYRAAGGLLDVPDEFVRLLDRSLVVCTVIKWIFWLNKSGFEQLVASGAPCRLYRAIERLERFPAEWKPR